MRGFLINCLFFLEIAFVAGLSPKNSEIVREGLKKYQAPPWAVVLNGVQSGNYAYTDADRKRVYIDMFRFANAPKSLANTVHHEVDHLKGRDHNEISNDIMSYKLTTDSLGNVIDDSYVWV